MCRSHSCPCRRKSARFFEISDRTHRHQCDVDASLCESEAGHQRAEPRFESKRIEHGSNACPNQIGGPFVGSALEARERTIRLVESDVYLREQTRRDISCGAATE